MLTKLTTIISLVFYLLIGICIDVKLGAKIRDSYNITEAVQFALKEVKRIHQIEDKLYSSIGLYTSTPSCGHSYHVQELNANEDTMDAVRKRGQLILEVTKYLKTRTDVPLETLSEEITNEVMEDSSDQIVCDKEPVCVNSKYRSADGSCNNLKYPLRGRAFTPFNRWLSPMYDDDVDHPKTRGVDGWPLPNVRVISTTLSPDLDDPDDDYSMLMVMLTQFTVHDINYAYVDLVIDCCDTKVLENPELRHPNCFSMDIPKNDYFYSQYNQTCSPFFRSWPTSKYGCRPGIREQINGVTTFIDASHVYGSSEKITKNLRSWVGGKLRLSPYGNVMPPEDDKYLAATCNVKETELPCFKAGDFRVNQNLMANALHQVFFREHNRIAGILARINEHWEDETLFQETRRIIGAMIQHIVFHDILPIAIGERNMIEHGIKLLDKGYYTGYDENEDLTLANGFAAGLSRYGHTLVQGNLNRVSEDRTQYFEPYPIGYWFLRPLPMYYEDLFEQFLRGVTVDLAQKFDTYFTQQLSNRMFQQISNPFGADLIAINIQRGRDHGLPGYTDWRRFFNFSEIHTFDDLRPIMTQRSVDVFKSLYRNVQDIDVYVGMLAEIPNPGELVGPLISCAVGKTYAKLRRGDRFWYENGNMESSFTADQLQEIRKTSFSRMLCDNTHIMNMQKDCMKVPSLLNPLYPCIGNYIPRVNLEAWREIK